MVRVTTSRPRHGRRFEPSHELELVPSALQACRALPGAHRGLAVIAEMTGPWGIPDFTALVGREEDLHQRLLLPVPPLLHEVDAGVVAAAHSRTPRSAAQLASLVGWPEATVQRRLGALIRSGALTATTAERYIRPAALQPLGRLYAVEAKVRDWRKALRQVRSYAVWADSYVLVMGRLSAAASQELLREVTTDQGGLVIDGKWVRRPAVRRLPPAKRLWAAEHAVAALL